MILYDFFQNALGNLVGFPNTCWKKSDKTSDSNWRKIPSYSSNQSGGGRLTGQRGGDLKARPAREKSAWLWLHLSPRLCPSTAGCSPPSISSIVVCLLLSCFIIHLSLTLCPSTEGCSPPSMSSIVLCLLLSPFT